MKRKILIVDTNEEFLNSLAGALTGAGYELARAYNGFDALRYAEKFKPDAVVTEIELPKVDGFELARGLKSNPKTEGAQIIFISSKTDPETLKEARSIGAKKFLAKPLDINNLISILNSLFVS